MAATYESSAADPATTTADTSLVVTAPAGITVGDVLVAVGGCGDSRSLTPPSGFGTDLNNSDGTRRLFVFSKVADSGDASASDFTFTVSGTFNSAVVSLVRISSATLTGIVVETPSTGDNDTSISCPTITTANNDSLVLWGFYQPAGPMTATINRGSERIEVGDGTGACAIYVATEAVASAGSQTGAVITKSAFGVARGFSIAISPSGGDVTAPKLDSATIGTDGEGLTLVFDENVTGNAGFTLAATGGAVTATYASGDGTTTLVYTLSRVVGSHETVTLDYTAGDVEDAAENALATIDDFAVTNNSTVDLVAPTASGWATNTDGDEITATLSESGCTPSSGTGGFTLSGTSATVSGWAISGTTLTLTLSGAVANGETFTIDYDDSGASEAIADAAENLLADINDAAVTNNVPGDELTAGTASFVSSGPAGISVTATDATGGTESYTYQWERNEDGGSYSDLTGETALACTDDTATTTGVLYGYRVKYDDGDDEVTSNTVTAEVYEGGAIGSGGSSSIFQSSVIRGA